MVHSACQGRESEELGAQPRDHGEFRQDVKPELVDRAGIDLRGTGLLFGIRLQHGAQPPRFPAQMFADGSYYVNRFEEHFAVVLNIREDSRNSYFDVLV